jgi:rhomboid protease GluP
VCSSDLELPGTHGGIGRKKLHADLIPGQRRLGSRSCRDEAQHGAAGDGETQERMFRNLEAHASSPVFRGVASVRLASTIAPEPLTDDTRAILAEVERAVRRDYPLATSRWWQGTLTYLLILANLVMFGVEFWLGGTEDLDVLRALGGLWPPDVIAGGEWWRLGAAMFLHIGSLHLIANMLALWLFGRRFERQHGWFDLLIVYGVGGLLSMLGLLWLMAEGYIRRGLAVGASGAIMAVLGAILCQYVLAGWRHGASVNRRLIQRAAIVIGVQILADLSIPEASFAGHLCGFLAGIAVAGALHVVPRPGRQD